MRHVYKRYRTLSLRRAIEIDDRNGYLTRLHPMPNADARFSSPFDIERDTLSNCETNIFDTKRMTGTGERGSLQRSKHIYAEWTASSLFLAPAFKLVLHSTNIVGV